MPEARRLALAAVGLLAALPALGAGPLTTFPALGADLDAASPRRTGRFRASCEDLGRFCFADACGGNQIDAALACRALCPSSVILEVVPGTCPLPVPAGRVRVRLRARG